MTPDCELLRQYAETGDEAAFAELVRRHLPLVYGTALRLLGGNAALAQDVAQVVFTDVARKAGELRDHPTLVGWLHTSTRFQASKIVRTEVRRRAREQEAVVMNETADAPGISWDELRPLLDDAIANLSEDDREAVLLRYFENKSYAEVGEILGLEPSAAHKRVTRAVDKMREQFTRSGVTASAALLTSTLSTHAATTLPEGIVAAVTGASIAGAAKVATIAATAAKGAAVAKGAGLLGLLWTLLWPTVAIFSGLFVSVDEAIRRERSPQGKDSTFSPEKSTRWKLAVLAATVLLLLIAGVRYWAEYPSYVIGVVVSLVVVHVAVRAWLAPSESKIRTGLRKLGEAILTITIWTITDLCAQYFWKTTFTVGCILIVLLRSQAARPTYPWWWKRAKSNLSFCCFYLLLHAASESFWWSHLVLFGVLFISVIALLGILLPDAKPNLAKSGTDALSTVFSDNDLEVRRSIKRQYLLEQRQKRLTRPLDE